MACDDPLTRIFRSLPLVDRRETRQGWDQLAARLPRRGVAPCEHVGWLQRHERMMQRLNEAAMESGQVPQETRPCPLRERYLTQRAQVRATRADECARFLQRAVLAWLYRPDGPMVRRSQREVSALFRDEGGGRVCSWGGSVLEHEARGGGVQGAAECVSAVLGANGPRKVPTVQAAHREG